MSKWNWKWNKRGNPPEPPNPAAPHYSPLRSVGGSSKGWKRAKMGRNRPKMGKNAKKVEKIVKNRLTSAPEAPIFTFAATFNGSLGQVACRVSQPPGWPPLLEAHR